MFFFNIRKIYGNGKDYSIYQKLLKFTNAADDDTIVKKRIRLFMVLLCEVLRR